MLPAVPRRFGSRRYSRPALRPHEPRGGDFEFVSSSATGGWYTMAAGIAALVKDENPEMQIRVVPGGGLANPTRMGNNQSQMGWGRGLPSPPPGRSYCTKHDSCGASAPVTRPPSTTCSAPHVGRPKDMRGICRAADWPGTPGHAPPDQMSPCSASSVSSAPRRTRSGAMAGVTSTARADDIAGPPSGTGRWITSLRARQARRDPDRDRPGAPRGAAGGGGGGRAQAPPSTPTLYKEGVLPAATYPRGGGASRSPPWTASSSCTKSVRRVGGCRMARSLVRAKGTRLAQLHGSWHPPTRRWRGSTRACRCTRAPWHTVVGRRDASSLTATAATLGCGASADRSGLSLTGWLALASAVHLYFSGFGFPEPMAMRSFHLLGLRAADFPAVASDARRVPARTCRRLWTGSGSPPPPRRGGRRVGPHRVRPTGLTNDDGGSRCWPSWPPPGGHAPRGGAGAGVDGGDQHRLAAVQIRPPPAQHAEHAHVFTPGGASKPPGLVPTAGGVYGPLTRSRRETTIAAFHRVRLLRGGIGRGAALSEPGRRGVRRGRLSRAGRRRWPSSPPACSGR